MMGFRNFVTAIVLLFFPLSIFSQIPDDQSSQPNPPGQQNPSGNKRVLLIIPNYRSSPSLANYVPLKTSEKFKLAVQDTFDPGTFALAAFFAGEADLQNSNPSFGHGAAGFGHYYGTAVADLTIGNFMTEAIVPALTHEDPRYFRRGTGSGLSRTKSAVAQIFWTHTDCDGTQFNYSEILGNSVAVAISNAYYPESRTASEAASRLGMQVGVDMVGNILKEFWPDIANKFARKKP